MTGKSEGTSEPNRAKWQWENKEGPIGKLGDLGYGDAFRMRGGAQTEPFILQDRYCTEYMLHSTGCLNTR
jgi:hypothetical protein